MDFLHGRGLDLDSLLGVAVLAVVDLVACVAMVVEVSLSSDWSSVFFFASRTLHNRKFP